MTIKKFLALSFAMSLFLTACTPKQGTGENGGGDNVVLEGTVEIGGQFPLTGELGSIGNSIKNGALLAVKEVNEAGGVDGKELVMIVEDDQCDQTLAVNALNKLINANNVQAIVGSLCSGSFGAMAPIANDNQVVIVSPGATSKELTETGGDYGFRTVASDSLRMQKLAEFAYEELENKVLPVLYINNDYGVNAKEDFVTAFEELGGEVNIEEGFNPGTTDFKTVLQKIKDSGAEGFFQIAFGEGTGLIYKQATEIGLEGKFFNGYEAPDDPQPFEIAKNAMNGVWYAAVQKPSNDFTEAYKAEYGEDPLVYAAEAYDAVKLIANAMNEAGTEGVEIQEALYDVEDYEGASGTFSIDENGDVEKSFDLVQIQEQKPVVIRPL